MRSGRCTHLRFEANHQKATQALNYFASKAGGRISRLKALKLVFFADRYHLLKYGRPVVGDEYWAMSYGPVPSMTADIAEGDELLDSAERDYAARFIGVSVDKKSVETRAPVDGDVFSESDLEALAYAWERLGHLSQWDLVELSHAYPEWQKHRGAFQHGTFRRAAMEYSDFFLDADPSDPAFAKVGGIDPFAGVVTPERRELAKEVAEERSDFESFWRA